MALLTTIPASIMSPMSTTTLIVVPVNKSPRALPIRPSGMVNMITSGCNSDSNCEAMTR